MIDAVIFDLDGVIVDSESAWDEARRELVEERGGTWRLGLASSANRPIIELVLRQSGLAQCFAATVSSEEVARGKPAPDVYLEAARRVGADPARCVAIEDSSNGLRSAAAAGMGVIAIPNAAFAPDEDALALADLVLHSIEQLDSERVAAVVSS